MSANQADINAIFGSTGSGKTLYAKHLIADRPRVMVWDPMDEYGDQAKAYPSAKPIAALKAAIVASPDRFRVRYVPRGDQEEIARRFDVFCAIAYALGHVALVVEELQMVTRPSWAPPAWSDCTLRGRHRALRVVAVSQRPASVDKNLFSNATLIRTGRLNFDDDVRTLATLLRVRPAEILELPDRHYIERVNRTGQVSRGIVPLPGEKIRARQARK